MPHPCCSIKKGCLSGIGVIRLVESSHHQVTPGSLSSGCCSVLRQSCLQGTWAHLHWMCSCLWSSSSTDEQRKNSFQCSLWYGFLIRKHKKKTTKKKTEKKKHDILPGWLMLPGHQWLSHLQFCFRRCSTWCPYSLGRAVQGNPRCGWRNPVSVQSMALSPCRLDEDNRQSGA